MRILALDLGKRRTGMALFDSASDSIVALDGIETVDTAISALFTSISDVLEKKKVTHLAVGLPLLPRGEEGEQAQWVRGIVAELRRVTSIPIIMIDERYTSMDAQSTNHADAKAACSIAEIAAMRLRPPKKT